MTPLVVFVALVIGYVAGSLRTFAFCGFWCETLRHVLATLEPHCGGWWRGERPIYGFFASLFL